MRTARIADITVRYPGKGAFEGITAEVPGPPSWVIAGCPVVVTGGVSRGDCAGVVSVGVAVTV
jgi:hypothetical protein